MFTCEECSGQGSIIIDISKGITTDCPICNGTGEIKRHEGVLINEYR